MPLSSRTPTGGPTRGRTRTAPGSRRLPARPGAEGGAGDRPVVGRRRRRVRVGAGALRRRRADQQGEGAVAGVGRGGDGGGGPVRGERAPGGVAEARLPRQNRAGG